MTTPADQFAALVKQMAAGSLDEGAVKAIVDQAIANAKAGIITEATEQAKKSVAPSIIRETILPNNVVTQIKEHTHPLFSKVMKLVNAGIHVLLIGPAGCGKSYLTEQVARASNLTYGVIHGTAGASESHLQGWLMPIEAGGAFSYVPAEFVSLWEKGNSLFCTDELDAFDPNMLITLNGALASGILHIPQRFKEPHVKKGDRAFIIATANTFGTGADILYAGRNQLDAATLDRFYPIVMDYDRELEKQFVSGTILEWAWRMREKVATLKLRRVISTRTIIKATTATKLGIDWNEVKRDLLTGWTRDELAKVGELQS